MSWLSDAWDTATSAVGTAASYTAVYAGSAVAVVGGAALDVIDGAVELAGDVTGNETWDIYEGSASGAALDFVIDGGANNLATYIVENPGDAGGAALKGLQHGVGSVVGSVAGIATGAVGLVADAGNLAVWGTGKAFGQDDWGYEGSAALSFFTGTHSTISGGIIDGTDWAAEAAGFEVLDYDTMTEEQRMIFAASKGVTEVAADVVLIAATAGTGAAAVAAIRAGGSIGVRGAQALNTAKTVTGNFARAAVDTRTGRILTTVDAGASIDASVAEVEAEFASGVEQKTRSMNLIIGGLVNS